MGEDSEDSRKVNFRGVTKSDIIKKNNICFKLQLSGIIINLANIICLFIMTLDPGKNAKTKDYQKFQIYQTYTHQALIKIDQNYQFLCKQRIQSNGAQILILLGSFITIFALFISTLDEDYIDCYDKVLLPITISFMALSLIIHIYILYQIFFYFIKFIKALEEKKNYLKLSKDSIQTSLTFNMLQQKEFQQI